MDTKETVSIIMGVFNEEKYINEAIDSIVNQTFKHWKLIICNDASTDRTGEILNEYKSKYPKQIVLLQNEKNMKLAYSLNRCLEHVQGEFVARMDGDDISDPDRLAKQVNYLKNNINVDLVGTSMKRFGEGNNNEIIKAKPYPSKKSLINSVPFNHATIMMRANIYKKLNGYTVDAKRPRAEDLDLWFRFFEMGFIGNNLIEPLYYVRENMESIKRRTIRIRYDILKVRLNGYRKLDFPMIYNLLAISEFIVKTLIPNTVISNYRYILGKYNDEK